MCWPVGVATETGGVDALRDVFSVCRLARARSRVWPDNLDIISIQKVIKKVSIELNLNLRPYLVLFYEL